MENIHWGGNLIFLPDEDSVEYYNFPHRAASGGVFLQRSYLADMVGAGVNRTLPGPVTPVS